MSTSVYAPVYTPRPTVPAHITDHKTLVKLYVIENRTVYIDCPADGIPPPTVEWLRDGVSLKFPHRNIRLLSNGHQLELRNVKLADEARYTCRARNMAGQQEKSFIVKVQGGCWCGRGVAAWSCGRRGRLCSN